MHEFFDGRASRLQHFLRDKQRAQLLLIQLGVPAEKLGLVRHQQLTRIERRHDRRIDLVGANGARDGIRRPKGLDGDAGRIDVLDARDLHQLVVRCRSKYIDGDRLVRQIVELAQAFLKSNARGDDLIAFVVAFLARLRRDRPDQALTRGIECSRSKSCEAEVGRAGGEHVRDGLVGIVGGHREVDAFRLEVTLRRSQEQCAVFAQPSRADDDSLLRIGRERQIGN